MTRAVGGSRSWSPIIFLATVHLTVAVAVVMTVSLRQFVRNPRHAEAAHCGEEVLVTKHERPYLHILPPEKPHRAFGAGRHLAKGQPLGPTPVPASEWKGLE